jgi:hypothetical protein
MLLIPSSRYHTSVAGGLPLTGQPRHTMTAPELTPILSQAEMGTSTMSTSGQLDYFFYVVSTPSGAALALLGIVGVVAMLSSRHALTLLTASALFCLTTMLHAKSFESNVLIGPLQSLRNVSRPLSVVLLGAAAVAALAVPAGTRFRAAGWAATCFYAFQMLYFLEYLAFIDFAKGLLAIVSISLIYFVCARTFGYRMQTISDVRGVISLLARVGTAYAAVNLAQILVSPGASTAGGRLIGISGNAQQMGTLCGLFILSNTFVFQDRSASRVAKLAGLATAGLLGLMLLWTGSRANILMTVIGVLMIYRLQVGRLLTFGVAAGAIVFILTLTFSESTSPLARFQDAGNTRLGVWTWAFENFAESPIFGVLPLGTDSAVESSYISALANTGLLGLGILLVAMAGLVGQCVSAWRLRAIQPEFAPLCDYFIGTTAALVVVNAFEGFATGILTFPLMAMYLHFAVGTFISEASNPDSVIATATEEPVDDFEPRVA